MTDLQKQLQNETKELRMTSAEKSAMRARLQAAMAPQMHTTSPVFRATKSPYQWLFAPRAFAVLSIAALLVVSTGTAYASTSSLPGGTLYPIKTNVIEPLTVAIATTPAAKAEANASIAATRVKEAQTLAARGALTAEVAQTISDNYSVHASRALALAADVDAQVVTEPAQDSAEPAQNFSTGSDEPRESFAPASATVSDDAVAPQAKVMSLSIGLAMEEEATTTATATPTVASTSVRNAKNTSTTTRLKTRAQTATTTLTHRINEKLSVQAKILGDLNIEVRTGERELRRGKNRDNR